MGGWSGMNGWVGWEGRRLMTLWSFIEVLKNGGLKLI